MSYNPHPYPINYSPYFQQSGNQDGRNQYTNQTRSSNSHQANTYQPLSAYQSSQRASAYQHPHSTASPSNNSGNYGEQGYGGRPQVSRAGYGDERAAVDTSALGNLAYASSLGRDNANLQQVMNYNRAQNSSPAYSSYNKTSTNQYPTGHDQSNGSIPTSEDGRRAQTGTASPSFGYSSNTSNGVYQMQQHTGSKYAQYASTQQSRPTAHPYQSSQSNQSKQPSRPSSGQAVQNPYITGSQKLQSPTVSTSSPASNNQNTPTHAQPRGPIQSTVSQPPATAVSKNHNQPSTPAQRSPYAPAVQSNNSHPITTDRSTNSSVPNTTSASHSLTTVDPSHVFNDVEYRRRQAAEAAKKKAKDTSTMTVYASGKKPSGGDSIDSDPVKNQMELEMKMMIEKMRDYKSKDPNLFSQVWEEVKKGQPQRAPSRPTASQPVSPGSAASPVVIEDQPPKPSADTQQGQLPPESELPPAEFSAMVDRGRFPAQRRRRGGSSVTPKKQTQTTPKGSNKDSPAPTDKSQNHTPLIPPSAPPAPPAPPVAQMTPSSDVPSAASVPTSKSTAPQARTAGGTYWPESKKLQLAEAARIALTSTPGNFGKTITAADIHLLLDQNPSYIQMCEILEYRGFIIDRGQFARTLLSAVPDLASATAKSAPPPASIKPTPNGIPAPSASQAGAASPAGPNARPQATINNGHSRSSMVNEPTNSQLHRPQPNHPPTDPSAQSSVSRNGPSIVKPVSTGQTTNIHSNYGVLLPPTAFPAGVTQRNGVKWADAQSYPATTEQRATKQDMARKRRFSEIIDLTQGLDDEDEDRIEPPRQRQRTENGLSEPVSDNDGQRNGVTSADSAQKTKSLDEFRLDPTAVRKGKASRYVGSMDIVNPMNKRQDALRRSSYNRKTIARDILVAIGKHPTTAPLNAHLDNLRKEFLAVNHDSDLSTFRWDLVDPGGPPPPPPLPQEEVALIKDDSEGKAASTAKSIPCPAVAVRIDASGRNNTTGTQIQAHSSPTKSRGLKPMRGGLNVSKSRPDPSKVASDPNLDFSRFALQSGSPTPATPVNPGSNRKGRPPGARNKNPRPDKGSHRKARNIVTPQQNRNTPENPPSTTPQQPPIASPPSRPPIDTTPVKCVAVMIPSPSPSVIEVSRASTEHPANQRKTSIDYGSRPGPVSTPHFKVYSCQWEKCPAELHSVEKLKKHMRKHRNPEAFKGGPVPCLWNNCHSDEFTVPHIPAVNGSSERERMTFKSEDTWDKHIEEAHINAIGNG